MQVELDKIFEDLHYHTIQPIVEQSSYKTIL